MMQPESEIKRQLDGSFWFFDQYGNVQHRFVDVDFIPKNKPSSIRCDRDEAPSIGSMRINWPSNAYELIDNMRNDRMTWQMIGQVFGASQNATIEYYKKKHRLQRLADDKKYYEVRSREIRKMLRAGWSQTEIEQETGFSQELIRSVASRLRRKSL
jgi:hypothetical protein